MICCIYASQESNSVLSSPCRSKTSSNGNSDEENVRTAVDYDVIHGHDIKMSLRRLQTTSSVASNSRAPLLSLLTTEGSSFHLPHLLVPRELRGKRVVPEKTKVVIGKHSGLVRNELGRGAYGVVLLMDVEGSSNQDTIALKVQYPTDCLAWEYEILRRMEQRLSSKHSGDFGFPRALSFISLADGGMMSMTAGSKSGLNLVDLANVYKLRIGEPVPEVIVLHYTSRMLKYVELLHWHGQILVRSHKWVRIFARWF